jgi:hypothetical protein
MISITCNQCKTVLTIDDAFAGGVCRCQHCGTIQTVPAHFKGNAAPPAYANPSAATAKNLYQNQSAARTPPASGAASPSGLDELAQIVASSGLGGSGLGGSGLSSSGLRSGQSAAAMQTQQAAAVVTPDYSVKRKKPPMIPIAIAGGIAGLAIVGAIVYFVMRGPSDSTGGSNSGSGSSSTSGGGSTSSGPAFCGVNLVFSGNVVYVLDRANSLRDQFDTLVAATFQSIKSLGPDRKFAVVLWNNGGDDTAFPDQGLRNATSDQIEQLQKKLDGVQATGSSNVAGALEVAVARNPGAIILVTAKSALDDRDAEALTSAQEKSGGKIKFYAFVIGSTDNAVLKMFVKTSGGQYRLLSDKDLRAATQ